MEKNFHAKGEKSETMPELAKCFRDNLNPSAEVLVAMEDMNKSYQKTIEEKIMLWISHCVSSFVQPFAVMMADIIFDIILNSRKIE